MVSLGYYLSMCCDGPFHSIGTEMVPSLSFRVNWGINEAAEQIDNAYLKKHPGKSCDKNALKFTVSEGYNNITRKYI